tara:strand:- start:1532 stop:1834 length:303 start_codon:yes stop_codon:yes gene_type:complete
MTETNDIIACPNCGKETYANVHSCNKCGAIINAGAKDLRTQPKPPRFTRKQRLIIKIVIFLILAPVIWWLFEFILSVLGYFFGGIFHDITTFYLKLTGRM